MKGIPVSFFIIPFLMRGKLSCILICLIIDLPDVLINHLVNDEAEGLV